MCRAEFDSSPPRRNPQSAVIAAGAIRNPQSSPPIPHRGYDRLEQFCRTVLKPVLGGNRFHPHKKWLHGRGRGLRWAGMQLLLLLLVVVVVVVVVHSQSRTGGGRPPKIAPRGLPPVPCPAPRGLPPVPCPATAQQAHIGQLGTSRQRPWRDRGVDCLGSLCSGIGIIRPPS